MSYSLSHLSSSPANLTGLNLMSWNWAVLCPPFPHWSKSPWSYPSIMQLYPTSTFSLVLSTLTTIGTRTILLKPIRPCHPSVKNVPKTPFFIEDKPKSLQLLLKDLHHFPHCFSGSVFYYVPHHSVCSGHLPHSPYTGHCFLLGLSSSNLHLIFIFIIPKVFLQTLLSL